MRESRQTRVRAWHSEERTRLILESIADFAIFMLDPEGRVESWNLGAERIKGYRAEEILGEHFSRFYTSEDVAAGKPDSELREAAARGRFEDEGWRVRKDGSRFWANVVISAMRGASGRLEGFAKVTRDLTERREVEAERLRRGQAEEAVRLRDEFLSIASHELRTPLAALHLQLQSIPRSVPDLDPQVARKVARAILSAERLGELMAALLDSSRLATRGFELQRQPFLLAEAVREVAERFSEPAALARCALTIVIVGEARGVWDRLRVEQVVTNLLSNAIKYGAGTPVLVRVAVERGEALLTVEDRGPGIPDDALSRIFGQFERAASAHHYGGMGLGLYVSREIVSAHGGSIAAQNLPGGGARFLVRLPLAAPDGAQGA